MKDILEKMDSDKRVRLINSAMKEFGINQFDKASTNVIVKDAGISKGLLYHYFGTKDALFDYILEYCMQTYGHAILNGIDWQSGDIINRLKEIVRIKAELTESLPYMTVFSKVMYDGKSIEEIKTLTESYMPDLYKRIYTENIDFSLFKKEIDPKRVIKMIELFINGFSDEKLSQMKYGNYEINVPEYMKEVNDYLELYKKAFYKK